MTATTDTPLKSGLLDLKNKRFRILLVDDDPLIIDTFEEILKQAGYRIETAQNGEEAISRIHETAFDLVLTDLKMDGADGIEVLKAAKSADPETSVVIFTGKKELEPAIEAIRNGVDDYLVKNGRMDEVLFRVAQSLEKREIKRKIRLYENILPVCCVCRKIRDDVGRSLGDGDWFTLEDYMEKRARIKTSHTYCPQCGEKALEE